MTTRATAVADYLTTAYDALRDALASELSRTGETERTAEIARATMAVYALREGGPNNSVRRTTEDGHWHWVRGAGGEAR